MLSWNQTFTESHLARFSTDSFVIHDLIQDILHNHPLFCVHEVIFLLRRCMNSGVEGVTSRFESTRTLIHVYLLSARKIRTTGIRSLQSRWIRSPTTPDEQSKPPSLSTRRPRSPRPARHLRTPSTESSQQYLSLERTTGQMRYQPCLDRHVRTTCGCS